MNQNYIGSVVFGAVALTALAANALVQGDSFGFIIIVGAAAAAWGSCYLGAYYEEARDSYHRNIPGLATASLALLVWAVLSAIIAIGRLFL